MKQCGEHLQEALTLGKMVLHRSGEEGIDELWGEPFKAFAFPIEDFYKSRYLKIAQTMRAIDQIRDELRECFRGMPMFTGIEPLLEAFAAAAKARSETLHTDANIFDVWSSFVASGECLASFEPNLRADPTAAEKQRARDGALLLRDGKDLVFFITRARVPMPKTTRAFVERCRRFCGGARGTELGSGLAAATSAPGLPDGVDADATSPPQRA